MLCKFEILATLTNGLCFKDNIFFSQHVEFWTTCFQRCQTEALVITISRLESLSSEQYPSICRIFSEYFPSISRVLKEYLISVASTDYQKTSEFTLLWRTHSFIKKLFLSNHSLRAIGGPKLCKNNYFRSIWKWIDVYNPLLLTFEIAFCINASSHIEVDEEFV